MGYSWENDCVGCERCVNCGRRYGYKAYYCDKCEEYAEELFKGLKGEELCWDCYKEQFLEKICDDLDDTLCAECGSDDEYLYLYNGEWVCTSCLKNMAERVEID